MTESDYETYNKNIITFIGYRTPKPSINHSIPSLYNETIIIITPDNNNTNPTYNNNIIQATQNYIDSSSTLATTVPYIDYVVNSANGIFKDYKILRIEFNNGTPKGDIRKVIISK